MRAALMFVAMALMAAPACKKKEEARPTSTEPGSAAGSAPGSAAAGSAVGSAAAGSAAGSDAMGSAAGSNAGSDTAGSAAGSGDSAAATGGGAGVSPDGTPMAHRAGMCPSTVLGATTTSALKGKTVVVTIESTDADAVAAIQKRADEQVAEKTSPSTNAGGGHDMKGTHGGGVGLCPVHIPDGAKATVKHSTKGAVVTIEPKAKADELAKDIASRIAKASDWVKANVKVGEQQNQGGVGGGKGEDGSNHSGKGDGKGHERRKGGGGAGTGGGGGAGTGGGTGGGSSKP